jgi:rhodanese-related sulfurtransferase
MGGAYAGDLSPRDAWKLLVDDPQAVLVDVRTPAEWAYVGVPDLSVLSKQAVFVPWVLFPSMQVNAEFPQQLAAAGVAPDASVLFLCRSGVRSRSAAIAMTQHGYHSCYNVAHGFEGDHDGSRHRGTVSGWKVEGLPWMQG